MAKPRRMSAERESRKPWWIFTALVVFLVVDVLLVVLALQSTASRPSGSTVPLPSASLPASVPEQSDTPAPTPDEESESSVTAVAPTRILAALDGDVAWRATTGGCPDATAAPELTTDGGESWKSTDITGTTDVRALQRIFVSSADTASFIGATGEDCTPEFVRTFVAGDDFAESSAQLDGTWFIPPTEREVVHSPGGDVAAPCDEALVVSSLSAEQAAVLCDDSSVHVTTDTGSTWIPLDGTDGAVALTEGDGGFLIALAGTSACAGVQLVLADTEGTRTDVSCIESPLDGAELAATTAIDWNADSIWAWVDDRLLISTDGGNTW
ncbi:hypothetical protein ELQ92_05350 [Labedella populi]|uniref:Exo-alpha-sialidase n=1 Tax=Labedella populi TaxID=2498850 RepID=A0A3S4E890_9MICO|nr:hypothetical protein [Labedella populi]RWZ68626.1 hypothetical protein ELQ92_05350 [Labedella populi]